MVEIRGLERGKWLVIAALAAGVLSTVTVVLALAAPGRSIPSGAENLSDDSSFDSAFASVAVSPDGDRVAVVWVEHVAGPTRQRGSVWLRWASESTGSGWSPRVPVFTGTEQMCAAWFAPVAITGTTAHVAYVVYDPCTDWSTTTAQTVISYTTCHLEDGGGCDAAQTITTTLSGYGQPPIPYKVDIALDGEGNPHFVYALWAQVSLTDTVYYVGGGLHEKVPESVKGSNPAITWSDGYAHVVWEEAWDGGTKLEIMYNRRDISGTWAHPATHPTRQMGTATKRPRNPDVAAYGDHVVVTWDWQWTADADQYALAYTRYLTGTDRWMYAYEVGTQGAVEPLINLDAGLRDPPYYTYTSMADSGYLQYLRPSVALDKEGLPTVVWHADNGTYDIMYSQAQSMTGSATGDDTIFSWSEPLVYDRSSAGDPASPVVAQAPVVSPTLHVAYSHHRSGDWETYYEGREAGYTPGDYTDFVFLPIVLRNFGAGGDR